MVLVVVGGINGEDSGVMSMSSIVCVFAGVVGSISTGVRDRLPVSRFSVSYGELYSANTGSSPPVCGARGVLCAWASEGDSRIDVSSDSSSA